MFIGLVFVEGTISVVAKQPSKARDKKSFSQSHSIPSMQNKVGLEDIMHRNGYSYMVSKDKKMIICKGRWSQCVFFPPSKEMRFNHIKVFLNQPITINKRGQFYIAAVDVEKSLKPLMAPQCLPAKNTRLPLTIVIDPGHGGVAKGTESVFQKLLEKNLTLSTAFKLRDCLVQKGFRVVLTREKDVDVALDNRTRIANTMGANLFISLHYNSAPSKEALGLETYLYSLAYQPSTDRNKLNSDDLMQHPANQNDDYSLRLAFEVQTSMCKCLGSADRGVRHARFAVLKNLQCPGILIEGGFMSHFSEARKIATDAYQYQLAQAVSEGILRYLQQIYR